MTNAHLVIDARAQGLPTAKVYYEAFPHEPSPLGELTVQPATTTAMTGDSSLFTALPLLARAGAGGAVILVCHAYSGGMLLPVAPGGAHALSASDTLGRIDQGISAEAETAAIRTLSRTPGADKKAVISRWKKLLENLPGITVPADLDEIQAEDLYGKWLKDLATRLEFTGVAGLRSLFDRVLALRRVKLGRLELRACNVGDNVESMAKIRKFFMADKVTAPTKHTFYVPVRIDALFVWSTQPRGTRGPSRLPGPERQDAQNEVQAEHVFREHKTARGFLPKVKLDRDPAAHANRQLFELHLGRPGGPQFILEIVMATVTQFDSSAWVVTQFGNQTLNMEIVRQFLSGWVMAGARISDPHFPVAGLWTDDAPGQPYVLPLEKEYVRLIAQSP